MQNQPSYLSKLWASKFKQCSLVLISFLVCIFSAPSYAQSETQFIKYKKYLIPINVTPLPPAPSAPATLAGTAGINNNAIISWTASTGAEYYELEWFNPETGEWELIYSGSDTSFNATGLVFGDNQFRVRACANNRCGDFSTTKTVTITTGSGAPYYGQIKGQQSVSKDGSFNYSLPLEVPPGINGMQPNLSFQYNSNRSNGLLGWGWQISGLSTIKRCHTTFIRDNEASGINTGDNYKYCLNGERLVKVGSNEYRTETERFSKLSFHGTYWQRLCKNVVDV